MDAGRIAKPFGGPAGMPKGGKGRVGAATRIERMSAARREAGDAIRDEGDDDG